eukprot:9492653-Pyramimonas_sp.AAC.1
MFIRRGSNKASHSVPHNPRRIRITRSKPGRHGVRPPQQPTSRTDNPIEETRLARRETHRCSGDQNAPDSPNSLCRARASGPVSLGLSHSPMRSVQSGLVSFLRGDMGHELINNVILTRTHVFSCGN